MIDRRRFLQKTSLGIAVVPAIAPAAAGESWQKTPAPIEDRLTIDTLCSDGPYFDPKDAVKAGLNAAVVDLLAYPRNFSIAIEAIVEWNSELRKKDSGWMRILKADDLLEARRSGRFGVILACQDGAILDASTGSVDDRNLQKLAFFYDAGLRVLQITHNERNGLGDSFREKVDGGLSRLGESVVREMNGLGMLVDLSHCGDKTTLDAIALSKKPSAVTHAGCRALQPTARNKTDECIRALAKAGGYFGIFNMSLWLNVKSTTSVDDVVDHIDHVVKVGGIDLPGFGSDHAVMGDPTPQEQKVKSMRGYIEKNFGLPGAERYPDHITVPALDSPNRMVNLADALARRGYKGSEVDKILGGNFLRVFRSVAG